MKYLKYIISYSFNPLIINIYLLLIIFNYHESFSSNIDKIPVKYILYYNIIFLVLSPILSYFMVSTDLINFSWKKISVNSKVKLNFLMTHLIILPALTYIFRDVIYYSIIFKLYIFMFIMTIISFVYMQWKNLSIHVLEFSFLSGFLAINSNEFIEDIHYFVIVSMIIISFLAISRTILLKYNSLTIYISIIIGFGSNILSKFIFDWIF